MPRSHLIVVDGASGSGKTTVARALAWKLSSSLWVHPDGLWDTPRMLPVDILQNALHYALDAGADDFTIVDCQIRPSEIPDASSMWPGGVTCVLLSCAKPIRDERLLGRGWSGSEFDVVESWDRALRADAVDQGVSIFRTDECSVEGVVDEIAKHALEHVRLAGA